MWNKRSINLTLAFAGLIIAFSLLELGARLLPPPYNHTDLAHICSHELGWRGAPNYEGLFGAGEYQERLKHNSAGMHDTGHATAKPAQTYRILMLGDSFTWAAHVPEAETAHQRLENLLNAQDPAASYEVISAAITGWSTGQQLLYYRAEGRFYQPDLVILMLYIGNDIIGNLPGEGRTLNGRNCFAPYFPLCQGRLDPDPWLYAPGLPPAQGQCSPLHKALAAGLGRLYQASALYTRLEPLFAAQRPRSSQTPYYPLYLPEPNPLFDYAWQLTLALIQQLDREVSQDGARLLVVLIPPADVVNMARMEPAQLEVIYQKVPELRQAQPDLPHQKLAAALSATDIAVLDLQPHFIDQLNAAGEMLYCPEDKHWNRAGNYLAAELMARFILAKP